MKRQTGCKLPALVGALLVSTALAACGAQGQVATVAPTTATAGDVLYVVDGGSATGGSDARYGGSGTGQAIVAVSTSRGKRAPLL